MLQFLENNENKYMQIDEKYKRNHCEYKLENNNIFENTFELSMK